MKLCDNKDCRATFTYKHPMRPAERVKMVVETTEGRETHELSITMGMGPLGRKFLGRWADRFFDGRNYNDDAGVIPVARAVQKRLLAFGYEVHEVKVVTELKHLTGKWNFDLASQHGGVAPASLAQALLPADDIAVLGCPHCEVSRNEDVMRDYSKPSAAA